MSDPNKPIMEAPEEIRNIVMEVMKLEAENLDRKRPQLIEHVVKIIKRHVPLAE